VKTAIIASIQNLYSRFRETNPTISGITIPGLIGVSFGTPDSGPTCIYPTRKGYDPRDTSKPFVQSNIEELIRFYSYYRNSKEYKQDRLPYAETILLKLEGKGFYCGHETKDIIVEHLGFDYRRPIHLYRHIEKSIELFQTIGKIRWDITHRTWENNHCIRISDWNLDTGRIKIQRATYFDQVGTNLTLDWASGYIDKKNRNATIRNNIEPHLENRLPTLQDSILANTLGVAAILANRAHDEILIPIRGNQQAIMAEGNGTFHCSASGVFETERDLSIPQDFSMFLDGMRKEIAEETGLSPNQYELTPLAFSRELVRGGKPQLFFIAETDYRISELKDLMANAQDSWEFIHSEDLPDNSPLARYCDTPETAPPDMYSYEGLMALTLAVSYIKNVTPPCDVVPDT